MSRSLGGARVTDPAKANALVDTRHVIAAGRQEAGTDAARVRVLDEGGCHGSGKTPTPGSGQRGDPDDLSCVANGLMSGDSDRTCLVEGRGRDTPAVASAST